MKTLNLLKITLLSVISCISIIACSDDNGYNKNDENITITPLGNSQEYFDNGLTFTSQSGSENIEFKCNGDWHVSVSNTIGGDTWCTITPMSGKAGESMFTVNVTENSGFDDRNVTITLMAGNVKQTIVVTQKQKDAILLTANKFELNNKGGKIKLEVRANIDYTVTINETAKKWIRQIDSNTKALSNSTLMFDISPNEEYEKREGMIYITSGDLTEIVHVYQASGGVILLTKNEYFISNKEQTIAVDIKSNFDFGVKMPDVNWISVAPSTKSMSSHTLYYTISSNEEYDSRESEIIFYDKNNTQFADTLRIVQAQKDAIIISKKDYEVNSKENIIEVEVNSNVDFKVSIPSVANKWIEEISVAPQLQALTPHKIYLKINENTSKNERSAKVIVKHTQNNVADTVSICQAGIPSLSPNQDIYQAYPKGGELSVALTTNVNYTVEVLGKAKEWITIPQTKSTDFRTDSLILYINENIGEARTGEVKIISENGEAEVTFTVQQDSYIHEGDISINNNQSLQKIGEIGYKQINGDLSIRDYDADITSLDVLSSIRQVNGNVSIYNCRHLVNFNGLNNLKKIQGNLVIEAYNGFNNIQSFNGLESLEEIGGNFEIASSFPGNGSGTFKCFSSLKNFKGLESLQKVGGTFRLKGVGTTNDYFNHYNINSFNELESFEGLEKLTSIGRDFIVTSLGDDRNATFQKLSSFSNLISLVSIGGNFEITARYRAITSLKIIELPALKQINGFLRLRNDNSMNLILKNLETLGTFDCLYLTSIDCPNLKKINNNLYIGLGHNYSANWENYGSNQKILDGFSAVNYIGGDLKIYCNKIESFTPMSNLEFVGGDLIFLISEEEETKLQSFKGFENLTTIGGELVWATGLSTAGSSTTKNNFSNIQSFQGFNNLSSVGGFRLSIYYGDFLQFTSFKGLESLKNIKGDFVIEVETSYSSWGLSDISALTNLETVEGDQFNIKGCYMLKDFTPLKQVLTLYQGSFSTKKNGYNPTQQQIINGEGKQ